MKICAEFAGADGILARREVFVIPARHGAIPDQEFRPHAPTASQRFHQAQLDGMANGEWTPGRDVMVFSDGDPALRGAVIGAAQQQVTHILDWFLVSMRVRHVEQALKGIRQLEPELKFSCLTSAYFHVPRLRHYLCSGYVVKHAMPSRRLGISSRALSPTHTRAINAKMKRFLQLIDKFRTYLKLNHPFMIDYCQRYWKGTGLEFSSESTVSSGLMCS